MFDSNVSFNSTEEIGVHNHSWIYALVLTVISISIIINNCLVIVLFSISQRLKTLQSRFIYISLALADLIIGIVCSFGIKPAYLGYFPYSHTFCLSSGYLGILTFATSIWSIGLLTIDRYLSICHPMSYATWASPQRIICACILTWVLGSVACLLPLLYENGIKYLAHVYYCNLNGDIMVINITFIVILYVPTFATMTFCYYKILEAVNNLVLPVGLPHSEVEEISRNRKAVKTVAVITGTFLVCWTPMLIVVTIHNHVERMPSYVLFTVQCLLYSNSFWNAIIYSVTNKDFKNTIADYINGAMEMVQSDNL